MRENLKLLLMVLELDLKDSNNRRAAGMDEVEQRRLAFERLNDALHIKDRSVGTVTAMSPEFQAKIKQRQDEAEFARIQYIEAKARHEGFEAGLQHAIDRIERALYEEKDEYGDWRKVR